MATPVVPSTPAAFGQQTSGPPASPEAVADFARALGVADGEEEDFSWIAEYGLLPDALPPGWTTEVDASTGKLYYVDGNTQVSSWENPLTPFLVRVVEAGRAYLQQPRERFFEALRAEVFERLHQDLQAWSGPHWDEASGREYYANSATGDSSWQDPRERTTFCAELEGALLSSLAQVMPSPDEFDVPTFGGAAVGRKVVTETGAEVLTLEGPGADERPRSRASGLLRSLALESSANERAGTLKSMGRSMLWLSEASQAEELMQRRQLKKRVELRRLRKLRQGSKDQRPALVAAAAAEAVSEGAAPLEPPPESGAPV